MDNKKTFTVYGGNMFGAKGKKFLDHMLIYDKNDINYVSLKSSVDTRSEGNIIVRNSKPIPAYEIKPDDDLLERIYEIEDELGYKIDILMPDEIQFFAKKHIIDMLYLRDSNKKSTVANGLLLDHTGKHFAFLDPKVIAIDNESDEGKKQEGHNYEPRCFDCYLQGIRNEEGYLIHSVQDDEDRSIQIVAPHLVPWLNQEMSSKTTHHPSLDLVVKECTRQADVDNMGDLRQYVDFSFYLPAVCACGNPAEYPYRLD